MPKSQVIEYRRERLQALIDAKFEGNKTALGKKMGLKSGAYIRQMLAGERPINEKVIERIESKTGSRSWFAPAPGASTAPTVQDSGQTAAWEGQGTTNSPTPLHPPRIPRAEIAIALQVVDKAVKALGPEEKAGLVDMFRLYLTGIAAADQLRGIETVLSGEIDTGQQRANGTGR